MDRRDLKEQNVRIRTVFVWLGIQPAMGYGKQRYEPDVWLTVHRNSVWIRKTN